MPTDQKNTLVKRQNKGKYSVKPSLKVFYTNADQLPNKNDELKMFIAGKDPDILLITEMIPKQQKCVIPSSLLKIDEYELYCNFEITMENLGASGIRGIAIYVKVE